jgi:hypothetical protein
MEAVGGDVVGGEKSPFRENGLHDLEAVSDPVDALEQGLSVNVGIRRGRHSKDDFGLDPRFGAAA